MPHHDDKRVDVAVVDTNVFLKNPYAAFSLPAHTIVIPFQVLEELDALADVPGAVGRNSRKTINIFESLRLRGDLHAGVPLDNADDASQLMVTTLGIEKERSADEAIMATTEWYHNKGNTTLLCSQDINMRMRASQKGILSREFTKTPFLLPHEIANVHTQALPAKELKALTKSRVFDVLHEKPSYRNQFIQLHSENNPENIRLFRYHGGTEVHEVTNYPVMGNYCAKNLEQMMALDLLMDESINLVSLIGIAGTGKTFLALLAGLAQIINHRRYKRLMATRPTVSLGPDIGFLPGDMNDKLDIWMQPIFDNISMITSGLGRKAAAQLSIEELQKENMISLQAITYMRGRSLPKQFLFVDEAQNLTPLEVKTLVTRAGHGTKVILSGDPDQIDTPHLSYDTNGLMVTTKKFKGDPLFGVVHLKKSERSKLAERAAALL